MLIIKALVDVIPVIKYAPLLNIEPPVTNNDPIVVLPFNIEFPVIFKLPAVIPPLRIDPPDTVTFPTICEPPVTNNAPAVTVPLKILLPDTCIDPLTKASLDNRKVPDDIADVKIFCVVKFKFSIFGKFA